MNECEITNFTCYTTGVKAIKLSAQSSAMPTMKRRIKFFGDVLLNLMNFNAHENMLISTHDLGWYVRVTDWLADK